MCVMLDIDLKVSEIIKVGVIRSMVSCLDCLVIRHVAILSYLVGLGFGLV